MKLTGTLAEDCPNKTVCPRIVDTDGDTVLVQGTTVTDPAILTKLAPPAHESVVQVPRSLIYGGKLLDLAGYGDWLDAHHSRDLYRLEVRDRYNVYSDGEDVRRYLAGEPAPTWERKQEWLDQLAADTAAGLIRRKVHLVRGPLSDYERYEFEWGFALNVKAGEQVRVLELDQARAAPLTPVGDVVVVDHEHVARVCYDDDDRFVGTEVLGGGEAAVVRALLGWIWDAAEPFDSWWDRHPGFHRDTRPA